MNPSNEIQFVSGKLQLIGLSKELN